MMETIKRDLRGGAIGAGLLAGGLSILPDKAKLAVAAAFGVAAAFWWLMRVPERWVSAFLVTALVLPPLPIELGNSGPHVCLLAALAGLLSGVSKRWKIAANSLTQAVLFLFFVLLASTCMAAYLSGVSIAAGSVVRVMLLGISVFLYLHTLSSRQTVDAEVKLLRVVYLAGLGSAAFACLDFYFQFPTPAGFAPQFVWLSSGIFRRAQGVFYEASTLGNVCAFFLVMILAAFARGKSVQVTSRPLLICGGFLFTTALILSYSRASIVNVAVSCVALAFLSGGRFRWRRTLPAVAGCVLVVGFAMNNLFPVLSEAYLARAASVTGILASPEGVLSGRVGNWEFLFTFLREHPVYALLGIGYKTIPYSSLLGTEVVSDNVYLGMLVEAGVLGLAAVLWLNANILRSAYRAAMSKDEHRAFFGTWIFCFWAGESVQMLSGDLLTYWRVLPLYFWVLAVAVRSRDEDPDRRPV